MKVPCFVFGSSVMLSLWLIATFLRPVPMETYSSPGTSVGVVEESPQVVGEMEALTDAH